MISMDKALVELTRQGLITMEEAMGHAHNAENMKTLAAALGGGAGMASSAMR